MNRSSITYIKSTASVLILLFALMFSADEARAQQQSAFQNDFRSIGLYLGGYSPSFNYFDRTFWDFSTGVQFGLEGEYNITHYSGIRMSFGFFSTSSEANRVSGTTEKLSYQFFPFSISPYLNFEPGYVTLFLRAGIDFTAIRARYATNSPSQLVNGGTTTYHIEGAIERSLEEFGLSLNLRYTFGSFDQEFTFDEGSSTTTESINLDGFSVSLSLKRLF